MASQEIFIDSGIFFYLLDKGQKFSLSLEKISSIEGLVCNVKTLQEIVYKYHLIGETRLGYEYASGLKDISRVFSVGRSEVIEQIELMQRYPLVSPRVLFHTACATNHQVTKVICSPDSDFSQIEELETLSVLSKICASI